MSVDPSPPKQRLSLKGARSAPAPAVLPWPVLVVDDDPQVHLMTRVLLRDFEFQGRPFEIISAHSVAEAHAALHAHPDLPVVLLDVVMETPDAGLAVARYVREELGNHRLRIILRTGQPGEAPERQVMIDYDINDYRAKTELTAQKLFTALVAALRSWTHIDTIERLNATLEARVAERTRELEEARAFAERLVEMLPSPVWFKDDGGRYRLYNRAFRDFFAIGETCWHGKTSGETLGTSEAATDAQLMAGETDRLDMETTLADATGMPRALMVSKAVLRLADNSPHGIIGVATDITERKALERELRRLATIDPLTGAFNRRHFMAEATQEMERAVRYGNGLSVIMLDIDLFKRVNDTHGHAMGDEVLRKVVEVCRANLREVDVFGRLGGEEFAALLPETTLAGAALLAERLRRAINEIRVPLAAGDLRITASLGIAEREADEPSFDHMLHRADQALYRAKQAGRDRVEQASSRG
ncbi:MAG: diguanylate cyclase [Rhodospirillaceae bacterium]|nr:diguanylate cyclase [Rhodospirillales bacterium]